MLGLGSEAAQGFIVARDFDPLTIAANILGSLTAVGICSIYHKRMLDRRRKAKGYGLVSQEGEDVELALQETGVIGEDSAGPSSAVQNGGDRNLAAEGK